MHPGARHLGHHLAHLGGVQPGGTPGAHQVRLAAGGTRGLAAAPA